MQAFRLINRFLSTNTLRSPYRVKKHIFFDVYSRHTKTKLEKITNDSMKTGINTRINTRINTEINTGNKIEMHESHSAKPFIKKL